MRVLEWRAEKEGAQIEVWGWQKMLPRVHWLNSDLEVGPQHSLPYCTSVAPNMAVFITVCSCPGDRPQSQHSITSHSTA